MSDTVRNRLLVGLAVAVVVLLGLVGFLALGGRDDGSEAASAVSSTTSPSSSTSSTSSTEAGTDTPVGPTSAPPGGGGGGGGGGGIAGPVAPDPDPVPDPAPAPVPPPDPAPEPIAVEAEIGGSSACAGGTISAPITVFWRTRNAVTMRLIVEPPSSLVTIDKQVLPIGAEDFGPYICGEPAGEGYAPWSARLIATAADGTVAEAVFFGEHRD